MTPPALLTAIAELLFGRKYFANIILTRGTDRHELSSFIFSSRQDAEVHRRQIESTASYQWVQTVSFRSRKDLTVKRY